MTATQPPFFLVCEPKADLAITPERYPEWRAHADVGGVIYWNREGMVRRISNGVLDNALQIFGEYTQMIGAERLVTMPKGADRILWEQADVVKH